MITPETITVEYGNDSKLIDTLESYGCARVINVFSPKECNVFRLGIMTFMESLGAGFDSNNPLQTWRTECLPPQTRRGMFQLLVNGMPVLHQARVHPKLQHIFKVFYNIESLLVSGDGINFQPPIQSLKGADWPHLDQTFFGMYHCLQSAVNLTTCDGGTVVWPKSHLIHETLLKGWGVNSDKNWLSLNKAKRLFASDLLSSIGGREQMVVPSLEGSVTLWLSSVIHSAVDPTDYWRMAFYISYRPYISYNPYNPKRGLIISPEGIQTRALAFKENRGTSHWSDKIFPKRQGPKEQYNKKGILNPKILEYIDNPQRVPQIIKCEDLSNDEKALYGFGLCEVWGEVRGEVWGEVWGEKKKIKKRIKSPKRR